MNRVPEDLQQLLRCHGQEHVLAFWPELSAQERVGFVAQLRNVNFDELRALYERRDAVYSVPSLDRLQPLPRVQLTVAQRREARQHAEGTLRAGEAAFLVVAGGQGSRLGYGKPKGTFPIGPVTDRSLFHIHCQSVLALQRRLQTALPFLVMTSSNTDADTRRFFARESFFGLREQDVWFFRQGAMPVLDQATGKLLLEGRSRLCLSPNGHGGALSGLAESGLLERLRKHGVRSVYYFQVDNPLVNLTDFDFIGRHLVERAEVSTKVIAKQTPREKVGNFVLLDGRLAVIEYSDLSKELAERRDEQGELFFWAGNPAIHLFDLTFLEGACREAAAAPWHITRKKVPHLDAKGELVQPTCNNALKCERFIFDVLPWAKRWSIVPIERHQEFEPLKNGNGTESPETVRQAITNKAASWLEQIGVPVPRDQNGRPLFPIEISPLFALDPDELAYKLPPNFRIQGPTVLS